MVGRIRNGRMIRRRADMVESSVSRRGIRIANSRNGGDLRKMMRGESVRAEWLPPKARLAGICMGCTAKMQWGKNCTDNCTDDVEQWTSRPRRANKGIVRTKQSIPHHRSCRYGGSREVQDTSDGGRPIWLGGNGIAYHHFGRDRNTRMHQMA